MLGAYRFLYPVSTIHYHRAVRLGEVPLEQRCRAVVDVLRDEPAMSVWMRGHLLCIALWPEPAVGSESPPLGPMWRKRGKASTELERAEALELVAQGWSCRQAADALGWRETQVRMWARRAAAEGR